MALINKKHALQLVCAVVLITVGSALLIAGFLVPPLGIIDSSVLVAFGEILTFAGALFGIDYHYKYTSQPIRRNSPKSQDHEKN